VFSSVVNLQNIPFSKNDPWLNPGAADLNSGNNVHAYADLAAPNGYSPMTADVNVPTSSAGTFDYFWDPTTLPGASTNNIEAVTTNLFFTMNYMHDLFYDSGFDEVSGNPQASNYGRGGVEGDEIHAEAQDYSGLDNANANAHSDGENPVVQMYLWDFDKGSASHLVVNSPASVAQDDFSVGVGAAAGLKSFNLTNDLVYYQDTTVAPNGNGHNACSAPTNAAAMSGKICLVDQGGGCVSGAKADNCVAAGAVGMVMVLSTDTVGGILGATDANLNNFAALAIGHTVGTSLETASGTVNVTMIRPLPGRDGSVDGTIMSHEWGHIMSNRLIGDGNGLFNAQGAGMGEGWSDFVALQTYIRLTDLSVPSNNNWNGVYPMGAYALGGDPIFLYWGIRRFPYSYDMTKDPLTFKHIMENQVMPAGMNPSTIFQFDPNGVGNSEAHNVGEIWASTLWDCYVGMLRDTAHHSYDDALTTMRDYIVASYKMTPVGPTMLEARDALLLAALSNTAKPNDFTIFTQAFARRGMGVGAVGPDAGSTDLTGVVESNFAGADLEFASATVTDDTSSCDHDGVLDSGETGTVTVYMNNTGWTTLTAATVKLSSTNPNISFPNGDTVTFPSTGPFENNTASVKIKLTGATGITNVPIKIDLDAPAIGPTPGPRTQTLTVNTNFDWANASSASDDFDDPSGPWTFSHDTTA
ncbi:MAG TPA: M36 family metallopeptidase, partial [Polyangia bacterium]